ncbi:MAG TPA: hypothetical protein VMG99_09030 [Thermoplasmata archaeon]|nr:hypothetical protein [Thermoplasmata archaeon]
MRPPKLDCPFCPYRIRSTEERLWRHVHRRHYAPRPDAVVRAWLLARVREGRPYAHRVVAMGRSIGMVIPRPVALRLGLEPGQLVEVTLWGQVAVLRPLGAPPVPSGP